MSLRTWLRDWLNDGPQNADRPQTPIGEITRNSSTWGDFFTGIPGLPVVTEKTALTISAVYACVNLIAGAVSAVPVNLYRTTPDGERDEVHDHDLWFLLNEQFLPRWSAANGWEYLVMALLLLGDGFAIIHRKGAMIDGLEPVHPDCVTVLETADRRRLVYAIRRGASIEVYDQDDILHFAGFGFDGFRGLSPLRNHLRMTGSVALATQEFAARFFSNNARPDIVLSSDQELNKEQADAIREQWESLYGGLANSHRPAVLGMGTKANPLSIPAEEAQLLETRQLQIEEVARIYGVPPFMIGHLEKTTSFGKGVEHMGIAFVRFALRQHLHKIQTEINRKFFRTAGRFVEFDTFELERADMKTLFDSYRVALGRAGEAGFMTAEEVRNKLRMKRKPAHGKLAEASATATPSAVPAEEKEEEEEA